jgi:peptidoglycan lytic transglycosylase G
MAFHMSRKRIIIFSLATVFLVCLMVSAGFLHYLFSPAEQGAKDQIFLVREGSTLKKAATELEDRGLIRKKGLFLIWARFEGVGRKIKAGEYRLNAGMSPTEILGALSRGNILTHAVTIPEGFTAEQIGRLLDAKGLVKKEEFLALAGDSKMAQRYGISGSGLEGFLYPDTYHLGRGLPASTIIDVMVKRFLRAVNPLRERAEELGMRMEDGVILASIVEKETGSAQERPIIASVFLNRLKKNMRLESDPTVIYGLEDFKGNLRKRHLVEYTPYNTYVIRGLPPGPIANPGLDAIRAVFYPAETDYLFFVSKNDGTHFFSRTLAEHQRAVEIYQKKKRVRHGKTS